MKRFLRCLSLALVLCLLLSGCEGGEMNIPGLLGPPATGGTTEPSIDPTISGNMPGQADDEPLYDLLFDPATRVELNIRMEESELQKLQADYEEYDRRGSKSPIYRMADLDITLTTAGGTAAYTIPQVGVRMKGNTSRTSFYSKEDGLYNLIHMKISFQETFDDPQYYGADALNWTDEQRQARKERTFAGLSKVDIKWNKNDDTTFVKETYAYEFYRAAGLLAPRTNVVSVDWSGKHAGLYTLYEPIDEDFLARNLPAEQLGGDLYKLGWTFRGATFTSAESMGVEDEDAGKFYIYDLKTNKTTSTHASLKRLIQTLNGAGVTRDTFAELVDTELFLKYAAVSYFLGNPDDLRNNYNNTYLYFRPSDGRAIFIPYDYDRCLGIVKDWDPTGNGNSRDDPFSETALGAQEEQSNPLFALSICKGGFFVEEFSQVLRTLSSSAWLTNEHFTQRFQLAKGHYENLSDPDECFRNARELDMYFTLDDPHNWSFLDYTQTKLGVLSDALSKLDSYVPGAPAQPDNCYIRAEFTNWDIWDDHEMTWDESNRCFIFTLDRTDRMVWKVYWKDSKHWYGYERLDDASLLLAEGDDHTNVILPAGRYTVCFFPDSETLSITPIP